MFVKSICFFLGEMLVFSWLKCKRKLLSYILIFVFVNKNEGDLVVVSGFFLCFVYT